MDLDLSSPNDELSLRKNLFCLKGTQSNGLILQIHPSVDNIGDYKKQRFSHCSFSENSLLALTDSNGGVYIVDLEMQKYWQIPHKTSVSAVSFSSLMKSKLLVALNSGAIEILHIETGNVTAALIGHSIPVIDFSYSYDGKHCLSSNPNEAIIWDLLSCTQAHKLSLKEDMLLKKALFMPVQNNIFACFQDDTMHVWKFGTFECIKQIIPEKWKTHHLKAVAFTKNGRAMVIGGFTPSIVIFCLDTWTVKKVVELPDNITGIKNMEFIPQPFDGGANKILGIVTNSAEMCFLDIESSLFLNNMSYIGKLISSFSVSPTGKFLASILTTGEANIYTTEKIFLMEGNAPIYLEKMSSPAKSNLEVVGQGSGSRSNKKTKKKWSEELDALNNELKSELNLKKLIPILRQYGEYPESYRVIIWRTILQLPKNQEAFMSLANRECHPSYANLESKYPMVNRGLCTALKRVLSSLAHWCPLFGEVAYLPEFVFPFVKLYHFDPFICFESVATIIRNWCQNWFEFYPFPPINILSMIENVLGYYDPELLEFYLEKNVTSCLYSCILMQTAFSEVLTKTQWMILWDHILSNEPAFIFLAVVAYNVVCRNAIKNCETSERVEDFFHSQNAIDLKLLISKCYHYLEKTPRDIHPREHLSSFSPLEKGDVYTSYASYPKLILDRNARKLHLMQKEEQDLIEEQRKALAMKKELDRKLAVEQKIDLQEEVFTELEEKFREVLRAEEERISKQRKKLRELRQELQLKELAVLEEVRDEMLRRKNQKKEIELKGLLKDVAAKKEREKSEMDSVEEEIRKYYKSLLLKKYRLKLDLNQREEDRAAAMQDELLRKEDKLKDELGELETRIMYGNHDKRMEIANKISEATDILRNIECDIAGEVMKKRREAQFERNKLQIEHLWKETKMLEKKLEKVLDKALLRGGRETSRGESPVLSKEEAPQEDSPHLWRYTSSPNSGNYPNASKTDEESFEMEKLRRREKIGSEKAFPVMSLELKNRRVSSPEFRQERCKWKRKARRSRCRVRSKLTERAKLYSESDSSGRISPATGIICKGGRGDEKRPELFLTSLPKKPIKDEGSTVSEIENSVMKWALDERRRLIDEAKTCDRSS